MMIMPWRCVVLIGKSECGFKVEINADICGGIIETDTLIGLISNVASKSK